jgi:hypothetical protein
LFFIEKFKSAACLPVCQQAQQGQGKQKAYPESHLEMMIGLKDDAKLWAKHAPWKILT